MNKSAISTVVTTLLVFLGGLSAHADLINGDFSDATLTHGHAESDSLGLGWYAKNADDGVRADPDPINWSTGSTVGTAGEMTHLLNSGSKTRVGQYFTNELTGTGWSLEFDLGGTGTYELLRVWAGTSAASPSGRAFNNGSDNPPDASLVDTSGWTEIVNTGAITSDPGPKSFPISQDLSAYDVMVLKFRARSSGVGTTYDNFNFSQIPEPSSVSLVALGLLLLARSRFCARSSR